MQSKKGFIGLGVLIAIVLGLVVIGGGTYYVMHQQPSPQIVEDANAHNSSTTPQDNTLRQNKTPETAPKLEQANISEFHASRQSGTTPLWNQYSWKLGSKSRADYTVDFGDGSSCSGYDCVADVASPDLQLQGQGIANHQYTSAGTYTVRLLGTGNTTLATQPVTIFASKQGQTPVSMWVTPVSGRVPLVASIGWDAQDNRVSTYSVEYGDGTKGSGKCNVASAKSTTIFSYVLQLLTPTAHANTYATPSCEADHTFTTAGTYTVRLLTSDGSVAGSVTVTAK